MQKKIVKLRNRLRPEQEVRTQTANERIRLRQRRMYVPRQNGQQNPPQRGSTWRDIQSKNINHKTQVRRQQAEQK